MVAYLVKVGVTYIGLLLVLAFLFGWSRTDTSFIFVFSALFHLFTFTPKPKEDSYISRNSKHRDFQRISVPSGYAVTTGAYDCIGVGQTLHAAKNDYKQQARTENGRDTAEHFLAVVNESKPSTAAASASSGQSPDKNEGNLTYADEIPKVITDDYGRVLEYLGPESIAYLRWKAKRGRGEISYTNTFTVGSDD